MVALFNNRYILQLHSNKHTSPFEQPLYLFSLSLNMGVLDCINTVHSNLYM